MTDTPTRDESLEELVRRVKDELRARFASHERPTAREYLERFPRLREDRDFAVSLIYEEFCLLEEIGECPEDREFCRRYRRWEDSLEVQLRVHRELSQVAGDVLSGQLLPRPGDSFHGFRIDSILGRGGTSHVYLAYEDAMGGRPVALKVSPDRGPEPGIMGCLDHPRIMPAFSVCRDPARGLRGLCMPYRSGTPLDVLVRRSRPLHESHGASAFWSSLAGQQGAGPDLAPPPDRPGWLGFPSGRSYVDGVAWIVLAVAQAVSHIHSCEIIHCDIKPSNVYVGIRDGPLLFDFGFARSHQARDPLHGGTLAYMAPEQLRAFLEPERWAEVGPASDIYALGLTLIELLLGRQLGTPPPSLPACRSALELLDLRSRPSWVAWSTAAQIPPALQEIIQGCLAYSPEGRYIATLDLVRDLERFLASSTASAD